MKYLLHLYKYKKNNYCVGDFIKIINNYTKAFKSLVYPLKIKRIEKNVIICDFNSKLTKNILM